MAILWECIQSININIKSLMIGIIFLIKNSPKKS